MGQSKRRMRSMLHDSTILIAVEAHCKIPRVNEVETRKPKIGIIGTHDKSRSLKRGELKEILKVCGNTVSVTKTPTFAIHQMDAMTTVEKEIAKASRKEFKNSVEFAKRVNRYLRSTPSKKNPSKQTPKGTMPKVKEVVAVHAFISKKSKRRRMKIAA